MNNVKAVCLCFMSGPIVNALWQEHSDIVLHMKNAHYIHKHSFIQCIRCASGIRCLCHIALRPVPHSASSVAACMFSVEATACLLALSAQYTI